MFLFTFGRPSDLKMMAAQAKNLIHFITAMAVVAEFHRAFPARITGDFSPRTLADLLYINQNKLSSTRAKKCQFAEKVDYKKQYIGKTKCFRNQKRASQLSVTPVLSSSFFRRASRRYIHIYGRLDGFLQRKTHFFRQNVGLTI